MVCLAVPCFPHIISKTGWFSGKVIEHKMCVLILTATFVWNISHSKKYSVKYYHKCENFLMENTRYFCLILRKLEFSRHVFEKYSNMNFYENPSSESQVAPCGLTDRQTHVTKLIVALRNVANTYTVLQSVCHVHKFVSRSSSTCKFSLNHHRWNLRTPFQSSDKVTLP